jgi:predicted SprT family Zn-dependent metalloprotease
MTIQDIVALAKAEAAKHGFAHVPVMTDQSKRRLGGCCHRGDEILYFTFSAVLMPLVSDAEALDTIRHEIAHAKAPQAGHGLMWQAQAIAIGCKPQACAAVSIDAKLAGYKYTADCLCGQHYHGRSRRPTGPTRCSKCRTRIEWVQQY